MQITTSWQAITTATGALVQKTGNKNITLCYHTTTPTNQDTFGLTHNEPVLLPEVSGKNIYAKTNEGTCNLSVEAI